MPQLDEERLAYLYPETIDGGCEQVRIVLEKINVVLIKVAITSRIHFQYTKWAAFSADYDIHRALRRHSRVAGIDEDLAIVNIAEGLVARVVVEAIELREAIVALGRFRVEIVRR